MELDQKVTGRTMVGSDPRNPPPFVQTLSEATGMTSRAPSRMGSSAWAESGPRIRERSFSAAVHDPQRAYFAFASQLRRPSAQPCTAGSPPEKDHCNRSSLAMYYFGRTHRKKTGRRPRLRTPPAITPVDLVFLSSTHEAATLECTRQVANFTNCRPETASSIIHRSPLRLWEVP